MLEAVKITEERFLDAHGQVCGLTGGDNWGVRRDDGAFLTFDGVKPYTPLGGRSAAIEVAATINPADVQWVSAVPR